MKQIKLLSSFLIAFLAIQFAQSQLYADEVITRTFDAKQEVKIELILGSCIINNSNDDKIHVRVEHSYPENAFEAVFKEREQYVEVEEKLLENNPRGQSSWTVSVPKETEIDFNSATGNLSIEAELSEIDANSGTGTIDIRNSKGEFELNSGTGSIQIFNSEGEFDLNSGTGKVFIEKSKGDIEANSGTGDVEANEITIADEADLNSGTGDVEVVKPLGEDFDLYLNSGTNDAVLDMKGLPLKGYFEMSARKHSGRIISPVEFKEIEDESEDVIKKSFTKDGKSPRYYISTGTGTAELKK